MAVTPAIRETLVGGNTGTVSATTTVTTSANVRAGDLLVCFLGVDWGTAAQINTPSGSGWTLRTTDNRTGSSHAHLKTFTRPVTTDGAQSVTVSSAASQTDTNIVLVVIDGNTIDPSNWLDAAAGGGSGASTTNTTAHIAPSVNTTQASDLLLYAVTGASSAPGTYTTPASTSLVGSATSGFARTSVYGVVRTATGATTARTVTYSKATLYASATITLKGGAPPVTTPTAPKITTAQDRFATTIDTTRWPTRNYVTYDAARRAATVLATMTSGTPNYAALRTAESYSFLGATLSFRIRRAPEGGTANAQAWMKQPDGLGVGRVGFELRTVSGVTYLDFLGQTTGYASVGTTVTETYDEHVHRWLMVECSSAGWIAWYSSVDGVTWTTKRSITAGEVTAGAPWATTRNDLAASFEAFRTAGTSSSNVNEFVVDDVNIGPEAEPAWTLPLTGGAVLWQPDWTKADNVAAGYTNNPDQRQSRTSGMGDTTVPYPVPIVDAPFGRSGRAMPFSIPDDYRRLEVTPPTDYTDGDVFFVGFSMLVEADMDRVAQVGGYYQIVWQLHHASGSGSPPIGIEVRDSTIIVAGGANRPDPVTGATNTGNTWRYEKYTGYGTVVAGKWIDVVMGVGMWSKVNSGRIDLWLDGVQYLAGYVPKCGTNLPGSGELAYPKHGIYHSGENRGCTVWIADYREGTSYAAVAPSATVAAFGDVIAEP